jgi:hypothetical protein
MGPVDAKTGAVLLSSGIATVPEAHVAEPPSTPPPPSLLTIIVPPVLP